MNKKVFILNIIVLLISFTICSGDPIIVSQANCSESVCQWSESDRNCLPKLDQAKVKECENEGSDD